MSKTFIVVADAKDHSFATRPGRAIYRHRHSFYCGSESDQRRVDCEWWPVRLIAVSVLCIALVPWPLDIASSLLGELARGEPPLGVGEPRGDGELRGVRELAERTEPLNDAGLPLTSSNEPFLSPQCSSTI